MINFIFYGDAVGKGRPRIARRGSYVHAYTPERTRKFEEEIKRTYMVQSCEKPYEKGVALYAEIIVAVKIPDSYSKKKKEQALIGEIQPTKRPDLDNICKAILDSLNGYAYADDSQVVQLTMIKRYVEEPYIEVKIGALRELWFR